MVAPVVVAAGIAAAASIASNLMSNKGSAAQQEDAQDWNAQQYATRYQTTVKDLRAAGLNPAVAMGSGYNVGSTAQSPMATQHWDNPATAAFQTANSMTSTASQARSVEADIDLKNAEADRIRSTTPSKDMFFDQYQSQTALNWANKGVSLREQTLVERRVDQIGADIDLVRKQIIESDSRIRLNNASSANQLASAGHSNAQSVAVQSLLPAQMKQATASGSLSATQSEYAADVAEATIRNLDASARQSDAVAVVTGIGALSGAGVLVGGRLAPAAARYLSRSSLGRRILQRISSSGTAVTRSSSGSTSVHPR